MTKLRNRVNVVTLAIAFLALNSVARAANDTYVSAKIGSDSNACTVKAPCLTFKRALAVTAAGGTVTVQDSGSYHPFTITKSVSIVAQGVDAEITALAGTDGVDVNAGSSDVVLLRGLTINGLAGLTGVKVSSVGVLHIENCFITGFNGSAAGGGIFARR